MAKLTDKDRIAQIKAKEDQLAARRLTLEARVKGQARKLDTRRKIVVGGAVLFAIEKDADLAVRVRRLLAQHVGRPIDRQVIADLLPPSPASPNSAKTSPA
jgi:hypothetical protein